MSAPRRRGWLVVLVALVGACRPAPVGGGRYTCDPSLDREPGSAQCPEGFRCGLERYCHEVGDTRTAWRCESAADCEGVFLCGLADDGVTRECHDPAEGKPWRCLASADCSGGFLCGFDERRQRRCLDPASPRESPCDTSMDCVAGWQCGLADDGTRSCHDPSRPQAWLCRVPSDCLGGWVCGLNDARSAGQCHDPSRPRNYACLSDPDCVASWKCGLASDRVQRECLDPTQPRASPCLVDGDCVAGWKCGLSANRVQRECIDPALPRESPCLSDTDCVSGWRCGLASNRVQRECHDPTAPRAWACDGDPDCLGGWRCDVQGACVDARAEGLLPTGPFDAGVAVINPASASAPSRIAVSLPSPGATPAYAFERNGRYEFLAVDGQGAVRQMSLAGATGGPIIVQSPRSSNYDAFTRRSTEVLADRVYVGRSDGLFVFDARADAGLEQVVDGLATFLATDLPVTQLRHVLGPGPSTMLAFSPTPTFYAIFSGPETSDQRRLVFDIRMAPGNALLDMAAVTGRDGGLVCVFAVDRAGMWVEQIMLGNPANTWEHEPVDSTLFGNDACPSPGRGLLPVGVKAIDERRLAVTAVARDGGREHVSVWDVSPMLTRSTSPTASYCTSISNPCEVSDRIPYSVDLGPCEACPGEALVRVDPASASVLEVACRSTDGGLRVDRLTRRAGQPTLCDRVPLPPSVAVSPGVLLADHPTPGIALAATPDGELWVGPSQNALATLTFSRAPTSLATPGGDDRRPLVLSDSLGGVTTSFGLTSFPNAGSLAAAVNEPVWLSSPTRLLSIAQAGSVGEAIAFGQFAAPITPPVTLARARSATGSTVAVVTSGAQLLAAEVDAALSATAPPAVLAVKTSGASPFTSLAFPSQQAADAGVWLSGFGVTTTGVNRVAATSPSRFRIEDLPLPRAVVGQEVWYARGRARLGAASGAVYSLPSRVRLAPPVPGDLAVDFATVCDQEFALGRAGLHRLVAAASQLEGAWERVPLPPTFTTDLGDGALLAAGDELYVFDQLGRGVRLTVSPCPAP